MSIDQTIQDAETSLDTVIGWFEKLSELRQNVRAVTEAGLADAQQKADDILATAKERAAKVVADAEDAAKGHANTISATQEHLRSLDSKRTERIAEDAELTGKIEAKRSHLAEIEAAITTALARFAPKG